MVLRWRCFQMSFRDVVTLVEKTIQFFVDPFNLYFAAEEMGNIGAAQMLGSRLAQSSGRNIEEDKRNGFSGGYQLVAANETPTVLATGIQPPPIEITK